MLTLLLDLCEGLPGLPTCYVCSTQHMSCSALAAPTLQQPERQGEDISAVMAGLQPGGGIMQDSSSSLAAALIECRCQLEQQALKRVLMEDSMTGCKEGCMLKY